MRILIVQHDDDTGLASLELPLRDRDAELDWWFPKHAEAPPHHVSAYDGVIMLGGIAMPDEELVNPWLVPELAMIREALEDGLPFLGICLGSQLLARAAGGSVGPVDRSELGWCPIELLELGARDPLVGGLQSGFMTMQWHHYGWDLPPGAVLLASSPQASQAFRIGDHAWGLQFHIEASAAGIAKWCAIGADELRRHGVDPDEVIRQCATLGPAHAQAARDLAHRFADQIERVAAERSAGAR